MPNILIVRSIFCPNYEHLQICVNNLINLFIKLDYQKKDKNTFTLYICGWIKQQYIIEIANTILLYQNLFKNVITEYWSLNYGKYKIINNIIDKCNDYDYIFYSDHDIIFKHNTNMLFYYLSEILEYRVNNKYKVGIVMLNQLEDIRHQYDIYENTVTINNNEYIYPNFGNFTSIASGCFYTSCKIFSLLDKFPFDIVYGLDDYYIIKNLYKHLYIGVVIKDYYVIHPCSKNELYNEWKKDSIKYYINNIGKKDNNYYSKIEKSMNLWI